ncbi:MAG: hypothetical protein OXT67_11945 [Zetaproteobacteria bacterium]|nr:hypothetical protein [Zetaproteobacteria bacterium]
MDIKNITLHFWLLCCTTLGATHKLAGNPLSQSTTQGFEWLEQIPLFDPLTQEQLEFVCNEKLQWNCDHTEIQDFFQDRATLACLLDLNRSRQGDHTSHNHSPLKIMRAIQQVTENPRERQAFKWLEKVPLSQPLTQEQLQFVCNEKLQWNCDKAEIQDFLQDQATLPCLLDLDDGSQPIQTQPSYSQDEIVTAVQRITDNMEEQEAFTWTQNVPIHQPLTEEQLRFVCNDKLQWNCDDTEIQDFLQDQATLPCLLDLEVKLDEHTIHNIYSRQEVIDAIQRVASRSATPFLSFEEELLNNTWLALHGKASQQLALAKKYFAASPEEIYLLIAHYLNTQVIAQLPHSTGSQSRTPQLDLPEYLSKFFEQVRSPRCSYLIALIYMERILHQAKLKNTAIHLNQHNVHHLYAMCFTVALKTWARRSTLHDNTFYCKVFEIGNLKDFNHLEVLCLKMLEWKLDVSPQEFVDKLSQITGPQT